MTSERTADADVATVVARLRGRLDKKLWPPTSHQGEEIRADVDRLAALVAESERNVDLLRGGYEYVLEENDALVAQHRDTQGSLHPDVYRERRAQEQSWGKQEHPDEWWLAILVEEVGEAAQGVLHERFGGDATCRYEVVQIAAVALAWLEWMDELAALASVRARTPA